MGKSSIGSGYVEDAQLNMFLKSRKLKNQKSWRPPANSDSSDVDEDKMFEAKRTQHLACRESLRLRCLKNRLNGNNKNLRHSELLDD